MESQRPDFAPSALQALVRPLCTAAGDRRHAEMSAQRESSMISTMSATGIGTWGVVIRTGGPAIP
jgi:hypothetical protein